MELKTILDFGLLILNTFYDGAVKIIDFFDWKIYEIIPIGLRPLTTPILESMGIADFSFLALMFGIGSAIYLAYQFVTWLLNIVT